MDEQEPLPADAPYDVDLNTRIGADRTPLWLIAVVGLAMGIAITLVCVAGGALVGR